MRLHGEGGGGRYIEPQAISSSTCVSAVRHTFCFQGHEWPRRSSWVCMPSQMLCLENQLSPHVTAGLELPLGPRCLSACGSGLLLPLLEEEPYLLG